MNKATRTRIDTEGSIRIANPSARPFATELIAECDTVIYCRRKSYESPLGPWFFTENPAPFIAASRRITGLVCFSAFKTARIDVVTSPKEAAEQNDLGFRRRMVMDGPFFH